MDTQYPRPTPQVLAVHNPIPAPQPQFHLTSLIDAIYAAALQPESWQPLLAQISQACEVDQCTLFYYDGLSCVRSFATAARPRLDAIDKYLEGFIAQQAAQVKNQFAQLKVGQLVTAAQIHSYTGKHYGDIVGKQYMQELWPNLSFQAGVVLLRGDHSCAGMGLQNFDGKDPVSAKGLARLQQLIPHLIAAMRIYQASCQQAQTKNAVEALMAYTRVGLALVNENFSVSYANPEALRLFKLCDFIAEPHKGEYCLNENHLSPLVTMPHSASHSQRCLQLHSEEATTATGYYLQQQGQIKITLIALAPKHSRASKRYVMLLQDAKRHCQLPTDYLHRAYGLTKAECELIAGLVNGASLTEAAQQRAVTKETARWQLKHILQKTETHSQAALSRLMLELCDS